MMSWCSCSLRSVLIATSVAIAAYYFIIQPKYFPVKLPPSQMLRKVVDYIDFIRYIDAKTLNMLNTDPFQQLINDVRPTLDELASIKRQTNIYERMEQIPGGPQTFIKSAGENLEKLYANVEIFERRYRGILVYMNRHMRVLVEKNITRIRQGLDTVMTDIGYELQDYKLYLGRDDKDDFKRQRAVNIVHIKNILLDLANDFEKLEELYPDANILSILLSNPDMERMSEEGNLDREAYARLRKYTEITKKIVDTTTTHGNSTITDVSFFVVQKIRLLDERLSNIMETHDVCKTRYEKLVDGIDVDIADTRERIKNLAKSKPRKEL